MDRPLRCLGSRAAITARRDDIVLGKPTRVGYIPNMQTRYVKLLTKSPASPEFLPAYLLLSLLLVLLLP